MRFNCRYFLTLFICILSVIYLLISSIILTTSISSGLIERYAYSINKSNDKIKLQEPDNLNQRISLTSLTIVDKFDNQYKFKLNGSTRYFDIYKTQNNSLIPLRLDVVTNMTDRIDKNNLFLSIFLSLALTTVIMFIRVIIKKKLYKVNFYSFLDDFCIPNCVFSLIDKYKIISISIFFIFGKLLYFSVYFIVFNDVFVSNYFSHMCQWDCGWYSDITFKGYQLVAYPVDGGPISGQANWAFFPLLPLINKYLILLFNNQLAIIAFNQVLLYSSLFLLYDYVKRNFSINAAVMSAFFLAISSENIYFMSVYTEILFLFLTLVILFFIERNKYLLACSVCGLLSAVRFPGFLAVFIILYRYLIYIDFKFTKIRIIKIILFILISCFGLFCYMIYLHYHVGDFLAFYHIQRAWGRLGGSWLNVFTALKSFWSSGYDIDRLMAVISICALWLLFKKKMYMEVIFLGLALALSLASKSLVSYSRQVFSNYALFVLIGVYVNKNAFKVFFVTMSMLVLTITFTYLWLTGSNIVA